MAVGSSNNPSRDAYETLLLGYAAGLLDQAQRLIVAAHMSISPEAREFVHDCEAVGGAMMERLCEPVSMKQNSLANVLSKLDSCGGAPCPPKPHYHLPRELEMFAPLLESCGCNPCSPSWRGARPGIEIIDLPLQCRQSAAKFMKATPAAHLREQKRRMQITLVLDGAFVDEYGSYRRGELVIIDEDMPCDPHACNSKGGVYMMVTSSTPQLTGMQRLLHSLFRF